MRSILYFLLLVLNISNATIAQTIAWAAKAGGNDTSAADRGNAIATDNDGNIYVTGAMYGTATFGDTSISSKGGSDIFLAKYSNSGTLLWARNDGGTGDDEGLAICLDDSGNCCLIINFNHQAIIGDDTLQSNFNSYALIKYTADGEAIWATNAGGESESGGAGVQTDNSGNLYIGFASHYAKYTSGGIKIWEKRFANIASVNGVAWDGINNMYITGNFSNSASFGSTTLTTPGLFDYDIFVAKIDSGGNAQWARQAGSRENLSYPDNGTAITVDEFGSAYVTGTFYGSAAFETDTVRSDTTGTMFLAKYNSLGMVDWVKGLQSHFYSSGSSLTTDSLDNCVVTGSFGGPATFDMLSFDGKGFFILSTDPDGNPGRIFRTENATATAFSLTTDLSANVYITGSFSGQMSLTNSTLNASGAGDIFVAKEGLTTGVRENISMPGTFSLFQNYPNPFNPSTSIKFTIPHYAYVELIIADIAGREVERLQAGYLRAG